MSELWVNDSGTRRQIRHIYVNDAGVARRLLVIYTNDAGTPRRIFLGDVIEIGVTGASHNTTSPTTATARYLLTAAGDIEGTTGSNASPSDRGDWITPQINMAAYECRATLLTGSLTTGTTGVWQSLGVTREWTRSAVAGAGIQQCTFTLEIRRASDSEVMDSATITLTASSA